MDHNPKRWIWSGPMYPPMGPPPPIMLNAPPFFRPPHPPPFFRSPPPPYFGGRHPIDMANPYEDRHHRPSPDVDLYHSPFFMKQVPPTCLPNLIVPSLQPPGMYYPYKVDDFEPQYLLLFQYLISDVFKIDGKSPRTIRSSMDNFKALPLNDQLNQFMYSRTLSMEQVRIRWQLVYDILLLLRVKYPVCEGYAFGSLLSGLSDSSSDIDLLIHFIDQNLPSPVDALQMALKVFNINVVCPHSNSGSKFLTTRPLSIRTARVPILRLVHEASSIQVDLSFGNRLGVQNSKLVVLYTNLDVRVFRFLVLLRYWLKFHNLAGPEMIKSYGLTILGLVFLMKKGIIPSVHVLQKLKQDQRREQANFTNLDEIDGWDASFCDEPEYIHAHFVKSCPVPPDFQQQPALYLMKLLAEFFQLFGNLQFGVVLISPLLGEIVLKSNYLPGSEQFLPEELDRYKLFCEKNAPEQRIKLNAPLSIQDPFMLNFNVSKGTPLGSLVKFQVACVKAAEVLSEQLSCKGTSTNSLSLLDIFHQIPDNLGLSNKKTIVAFKADWRKRRFFTEILRNFNLKEQLQTEVRSNGDALLNQRNGYVRLPKHLIYLDRLLCKPGTLKKLKKTVPSSEFFYTPFAAGKFTGRFFEELQKAKIWTGRAQDWLRMATKLVSLWKSFLVDFVRDFFEVGLRLNLDEDDMLKTTKVGGHVEIEELLGIEFVSSWSPHAIKEVHKFYEPEVGQRLAKALDNVEAIPEEEEVVYMMFGVTINSEASQSQFWRVRPPVGAANGVENPLEQEGAVTDQLKEKFKMTAGNGKSEEKRAKLDAGFRPFKISVMVKISSGLEDKEQDKKLSFAETGTVMKPAAKIMIQCQDAEADVDLHLSKMMGLMQHNLPGYLQFRLRQWLTQIDGIQLEETFSSSKQE